MLNLTKSAENGKTTIALKGRLDTVTAPEFESYVKSSFDETNELVLDFSELEYISSAGLRVLLASQKEMAKRGGMKLVNVNETVMEIFEVTGFSDILDIA